MKYYIHSRTNNQDRKANYEYSTESFFVLTSDNWDDYSYKTTFNIDYFEQGIFKEIGIIKILKKDSYNTKSELYKDFQNEFSSLPPEYISLGADKSTYEALIKNFSLDEAYSILKDLNDISIKGLDSNPNFDINDEGIQSSFFRSSVGRYLYEEVENIYFKDKRANDRAYKFIYKFNKKDDDFLDIEIDFSKYKELPNRFFTLIGKNGVGKTSFLNQLSASLFDSSNPKNKDRFKINGDFKIPTYQKVIAISFSVFDNFFKGGGNSNKTEQDNNETKKANYTYIGLHKLDNTVYCSEEICQLNLEAYKKLKEKDRNDRFIELLNRSGILNEKIDTIENSFFTSPFSSGQNVFISMLCRFLLEIEDGSLIFLDEPELYLHPNAIASLMKIFNDLLSEYQSYAILCTHSPILIQEMPSRYVRNLSLNENGVLQTEVSIETFGANISEITKDIFNVTEQESLYKTTLKDLSEKHTESEIDDFFSNELSLKARMFLSSLFVGEE